MNSRLELPRSLLRFLPRFLPFGLVPMLAACGGGEGSLEVTAYGEAFIEEGIAAADMEDGWAVEFSRFEIALEDVEVAGVAIPVPGTVGLTEPSEGAGQVIGNATVPAGEHTDATFTVTRVEVEGTATKGEETRSFSWAFDAPTRYSECETTTSVPIGGEGSFQITIHADHLFADSLVAEEPALRFQALADADADGDGVIGEDELAATDIGAYDPGSEGGIDDLWAWLSAQVRSLGHVDGEGHCKATAAN